MDAQQKLLCSVLCYLLFSLLSGKQVLVQGHSASDFRPSKLFVFGDSYADTGNTDKSESAWKHPYGITFPGKPYGRFSDGRVLTDYVAKFIGIKTPIQYRWGKYGISLLRYGMNFAYGGTGVFDTVVYPGPNMTTQIDFFQHLIREKVFTAKDLKSSVCLVSAVGNDYTTYIARNGSAQGWQSFITALINQLAVNLKRIHGLGVKKIAVTGLQPLGCLPERTANSSFRKCNAVDNSLVNFHNFLLQQAVDKLNNETNGRSSFVILDLYDSFMSVLENKGNIKFESPMKPCCFGISSHYSCGSVDENGEKKYTVCEDPKSALFWDGAHPTQEGWLAVFHALQATLQQLYY